MEKSGTQEGEQINFSQTKANPLQKVGIFIKEARIGRGISIDDLATSLRISKEQLIAIETGREDSLPEKVFIKAMVRRISEKLSLDTDFLLEELRDRDQLNTRIQLNEIKEKKPIKHNRIPFIFIILIAGLLGIGASLLVINHLRLNSINSIENKNLSTGGLNKKEFILF